MELKHAGKAPKAAKDLLFVVFVSNANVAQAAEYVNGSLGCDLQVDAAAAEKGLQTYRFDGSISLALIGLGNPSDICEGLRKGSYNATTLANDHNFKKLAISYPGLAKGDEAQIVAIAESIFLSNYQFLRYKSKKEANTLASATVISDLKNGTALVERAGKIAKAVTTARDLVNEPVITLTAKALAAKAVELGKEYGFSTEVFDKKKIESLKMGGLLAVNYGSIDPPTFTIMEYKPAKPKNKRPVVIVGKGVVFDTGGLSLKPTPNSMDSMKSDMAGAAATICTMCSIAALELPVHVIGLVPATDNRPGENAYTPGDVIKMYDGSTVEVLNTDAEGRMILADALAYAKKYKPELVIDLATLTGAQIVAVGYHGSAFMGTAPATTKQALQAAGQRVYERLVELPLWEEYKDQLKSDIADMKNIGGSSGGCITAGKFLEQFTDYPWIHIDIAGPSFLSSADSYRGKNGTGVGVRLLTEFLSNY
ncbi:MAG: leucyl aminopeptidase [Bacteroidia bacterium]